MQIASWRRWRTERDALFARHPATPLPADARDAFDGLPLYDYDPASRVLVDTEPAPEHTIALAGSDGAAFGARRFATACFTRDATSGETTYGARPYLLDTVKATSTVGSCSTSTSRTTRRARTSLAGAVR